MITAVDTSVLLDLFGADPTYGPRAKDAVRNCRHEGRLTACEIVWAEIAGIFPSPEDAKTAMQQLGVEFSVVSLDAAMAAGLSWKAPPRGAHRRGHPATRVP